MYFIPGVSFLKASHNFFYEGGVNMNLALKTSKPILFFALGILLISGYALLLHFLPIAELTKEFGVPSAVGALVANAISGGSTAITVIGILAGFLTGGLGLIANAGRAALMAYLKKELEKRGRKAFIAW